MKGLSPAAFYTEVPVTLTAVMYNFLQENPFTSYGEMVIITVQNLILVLLLWTYMKPPASMGTIAAVLGAFIGIAVACLYTPSEWQFLIPFCGLPMVLYSRGIQVNKLHTLLWHKISSAL